MSARLPIRIRIELVRDPYPVKLESIGLASRTTFQAKAVTPQASSPQSKALRTGSPPIGRGRALFSLGLVRASLIKIVRLCLTGLHL